MKTYNYVNKEKQNGILQKQICRRLRSKYVVNKRFKFDREFINTKKKWIVNGGPGKLCQKQ